MSDPRTTLFAAIGSALNQWGGVEFALAGMFEIISNIPSPKKSNAIFDAIVSFEARVDVLQTLMAFEPLTDLERETWNRFALKLKKKYKKRHELAHFTVLSNADGTNAALSPFYSFGAVMRDETKSLSLIEIRERQNSFADLHMAITWFRYEAMKRRGLIEGNPTPMTQTVIHCHESASLILEQRVRKRQQPQPE